MEINNEGFLPVYNAKSRVLILGSFPSVKSRETGFYYGNKQNKFWRILNTFFQGDAQTIEEKKQLILTNNLALWDIAVSCEIAGSSDSSIKNVVFADIAGLLKKSKVEVILCNGKTSYNLTKKYFENTHFGACPKIICLPSTSPANVSFDENIWQETLRKYCKM